MAIPNNKRKVPIKYTSRDFNSIKNDLIEYAKRYYPNTYRDFNEASFGSLMMDTVAYVGDMLSFYLDYQANESFLDTSIEYDNIIKHGRQKGYRFKGRPTSTGIQTFYVIVPSNINGLGPDTDFIPRLKRGSTISSTTGNQFILTENVDFSLSSNEIVVAEVDDVSGVPVSYAIKAHGRVISGEIVEEYITVGDYVEFFKAELSGEDIAEIISVSDSEGHDYYEVDYLSQNVIYVPIVNRGADAENAPNILKPVAVPRRFVVEQDSEKTFLQFGFGSEENINANSVVDPTEVVLNLHGRDYNTDTSFDPTKLMESDKFGVAPANTILQVVYRRNTVENVNAAMGSIIEVDEPEFEFENIVNLDQDKVSTVVNSLETTNEKPIIGDVTLPSSDELKVRIQNTFAAQNRAVTREDYKAMIYSMPPQFGAIKRCGVIPDSNSFKRNLNLYIISENSNGTLVETSSTIKSNLKMWLAQNKMVNDTIDILNARIINIGIEFEIIAESEENKYSVLNSAVEKLADRYRNHFDIGETILISEIYNILNETEGVADTVKVEIVRMTGANYADIGFNIDEYLSADGRLLYCPQNCIFEIKYPRADFKGSVK